MRNVNRYRYSFKNQPAMKYKLLFSATAFLFSLFSVAQVAVNTDGTPANASAMLDVKSTTRGFLPPCLTAAQRGAIASPAAGLMVWQTDSPTGYCYYNGTGWSQEVNVAASGVFPANNTLITSDGTNWVSKSLSIGSAGGSDPVDNMQPFLTLNYCIALWGSYPSPSGSNPFMGEVDLFGFGIVPSGWAVCNGQLLAITENETLFTLIGTTFGGDGQVTFGVPDLRGRVGISQGLGPGGVTRYMGEYSGTESHVIAVYQLPVHTHPVTFQ